MFHAMDDNELQAREFVDKDDPDFDPTKTKIK